MNKTYLKGYYQGYMAKQAVQATTPAKPEMVDMGNGVSVAKGSKEYDTFVNKQNAAPAVAKKPATTPAADLYNKRKAEQKKVWANRKHNKPIITDTGTGSKGGTNRKYWEHKYK